MKRVLDRKGLYSGTYCYAGIEAPGQHQALVQDGPETLQAGIVQTTASKPCPSHQAVPALTPPRNDHDR